MTAAIALFGWLPFSIICFRVVRPQKTILIVIVGGWLFLPQIGYDLQGLPRYDKYMAIALSLLFGNLFSSSKSYSSDTKINARNVGRWCLVIWSLCPFITSINNDLGAYNGLSSVLQSLVKWGVPFYFGTKYFSRIEDLRSLSIALVIGGLLYVPLCLFEVRMSPQLSNIFYGFFPLKGFSQLYRYGGYRPIVFMQHGLMVALWMALTTVVSYALWRSREVASVCNIPIQITFVALLFTTFFCKSKGAISLFLIGCTLISFFKWNRLFFFLSMIPLFICLYPGLRMINVLSVDQIVSVATRAFDQERVDSLKYRLDQEEITVGYSMRRKWFGWGGYGRNRPQAATTGMKLDTMDSLWLITFSTFGFAGFLSLFGFMLYGPWKIFRYYAQNSFSIRSPAVFPVVLGLVVVLFMVDQLFNSMVNPIYILVSGGLLGFAGNCTYQGQSERDISF